MTESVTLVDTALVRPNPENPRLIFHQKELAELQRSIEQQGILVPLTLYRDSNQFFILDGERRWRCARKLNLPKVPAIIAPKPDRLQNIMMMFAIHNARRDWDPLPTAYKLQVLEDLLAKRMKDRPTERRLAEAASMPVGEIRRLKKLLGLPQEYRDELMQELEKPRSEQLITVDHVLEVTRAAEALRKRGIIEVAQEDLLRRALLDKFRAKIERNTVEPRKLARLARAVEREQVPIKDARRAVKRLVQERECTIATIFDSVVAAHDFSHGVVQLIGRLSSQLEEHSKRRYSIDDDVREQLTRLRETINDLLSE